MSYSTYCNSSAMSNVLTLHLRCAPVFECAIPLFIDIVLYINLLFLRALLLEIPDWYMIYENGSFKNVFCPGQRCLNCGSHYITIPEQQFYLSHRSNLCTLMRALSPPSQLAPKAGPDQTSASLQCPMVCRRSFPRRNLILRPWSEE